jgi:hypothetical protein
MTVEGPLGVERRTECARAGAIELVRGGVQDRAQSIRDDRRHIRERAGPGKRRPERAVLIDGGAGIARIEWRNARVDVL